MKKFAILLAAMAAAALFSMSVFAGQWQQIGNDWYYYEDEFVGEGIKYTDGGAVIYNQSEPSLAEGIKEIDGSIYFFDYITGRMITNETIHGYYFGSDGKYDSNISLQQAQLTQGMHVVPEIGKYYWLNGKSVEVVYSDLNTIIVIDEGGETSVYYYRKTDNFDNFVTYGNYEDAGAVYYKDDIHFMSVKYKDVITLGKEFEGGSMESWYYKDRS